MIRKIIVATLSLCIYLFTYCTASQAGFFNKLFGNKNKTKSVKDVKKNKAKEAKASKLRRSETMSVKPFIVCRKKGCVELNQRMTSSYLFNQIVNLFHVNNKTKVHLCEADTNTRVCKSHGMRFAINVGAGTASVVNIPSFTISDVLFAKNLKSINIALLYDIYANGLKTYCATSYNKIHILGNKQAIMKDKPYNCQFASDIPTEVHSLYNIDYIDLDYGIVGAYYSIDVNGASFGGQAGYILLKFQYTSNDNIADNLGNCNSDACSEEYNIPEGQYEIIPVKKI